MPYKDRITRNFYMQQYCSIRYQLDPKHRIEKSRNRRRMLRDWVNSFKEQCFKCKTNDKLELHHIDPREKFKNVSSIVTRIFQTKNITGNRKMYCSM